MGVADGPPGGCEGSAADVDGSRAGGRPHPVDNLFPSPPDNLGLPVCVWFGRLGPASISLPGNPPGMPEKMGKSCLEPGIGTDLNESDRSVVPDWSCLSRASSGLGLKIMLTLLQLVYILARVLVRARSKSSRF